MSRHIIRTFYEGAAVTVLAGFDRQLQAFFLSIAQSVQASGSLCQMAHCRCHAHFIYDSMLEPKLDWQDINTLLEKLFVLDVKISQSLIDALYLDQCFNEGNRHMEHFMESDPQHLPA